MTTFIPPIPCNQPEDVAEVIPLDGYRLRVRFVDGTSGTVELSRVINSPQVGVFAPLADLALFSQVSVEYGAVTWPGELDLAPDAMYAAFQQNGQWIIE